MLTVVYVSCSDGPHIAVLHFDPLTGSIHEIGRVVVPGGVPSPGSLPMAVSADRRFLYAGLRDAPHPVTSFAIDPRDGGLSVLGTAVLADSMCYLAVDATGRSLFSASYGGSKLAVNPIGADGVAGDPAQMIATPPKAHCAVPDPANRFVYAASLGGDAILCQAFDAATGRLAPTAHIAGRTKPGAGPRHIVFGQGGRFLYVINELDGSIAVFARDPATGALTERQVISLLPDGVSGASAADIHLTPDGRFLYGSERRTHTLVGFTVDPADGTLAPLCRVPSEATPRGFAIAPGGRFLLCAGMTSGRLGVNAIDQETGVLVPTGAIEAGMGANWVEIIQLKNT